MKPIIAALVVLTAVGSPIVHAQTRPSADIAGNSMGMPVREAPPMPDARATRAVPVGTGFTYQGTLDDGGVPADGAYDIRFTLTDEMGTVIAGPVCVDNIVVIEGLFTVELDFGPEFVGDARELEIAVRPGGTLGNCDIGGGYTTLSPRQKLNPSPYALGLALPYQGMQESFSSVFTIRNTFSTPGTSGILGILDSPGTFGFTDKAGVRGESTSSEGAGVLGISDHYVGVVGYTSGDSGVGVFGRADGTDGVGLQGWGIGPGSRGVYGLATAPESWAGYFVGSLFTSGPVGIGTLTPEAELEVNGTTKTDAFAMPSGASAGKVLTSDSLGNGTWQPLPTWETTGLYRSGPGTIPQSTTQFLSTILTITVDSGQRVYVSANQTFGTLSPSGAGNLDLYIGYRVAGSGAAPTLVGGGMLNIAVPQGMRMPFGISGVISGLPAGTYEVGMAGDDDGDGNWNNNEWGYVSALIFD